ncbi:MAG TPA: hypothetical protein ENJ46_03355 [Hellea balneolensis]|uniref:Uncharacterized protein n=1 Tax=Hellea balneolensis TaxID=287478 RepID=A0A7C3GLA8_9PROT|nr:hypothetical protein [Hellea balneolensis]
MKLISSLVLIAACAVFPLMSEWAYADEAAARKALDVAFQDMQARADKMPDVRFAFTSTYTLKENKKGDGESEKVVYRFDPSKPEDQQYTIISPAREGHKKLYKKARKQFQQEQKRAREKGVDQSADRSLLVKNMVELTNSDTEGEDDSLNYLRETDHEYIFGFQPGSADINIGGDDSDDDDEDANKDKPLSEKQKKRLVEITEALKGEMAVDKDKGLINWFRLFSVKPFHPMSGVKVKEMDMHMVFTQLPDGGPYVIQDLQAKVRAKLVVIKVSENEKISNRDFEIK